MRSGRELCALSAVVLADLGDVVLMACTCQLFIGDDAERMCHTLGINVQSFLVDALQCEIHHRAVIRAATKFNIDNGIEVNL